MTIKHQPKFLAQREMTEHYKELFTLAVEELRFERLRSGSLLASIGEIRAVSSDSLIHKLCDMATERDSVDQIIQMRFRDNNNI